MARHLVRQGILSFSPSLWNSLLTYTKAALTNTLFKTPLKTHLFRLKSPAFSLGMHADLILPMRDREREKGRRRRSKGRGEGGGVEGEYDPGS